MKKILFLTKQEYEQPAAEIGLATPSKVQKLFALKVTYPHPPRPPAITFPPPPL
jgi:hypothetical protein